jgi:pyruvyltransferase
MMRKIRSFIWHYPAGAGNFGDEMTYYLLERLFGVIAVPVKMQNAELLATGSLLDAYWRSKKGLVPRRHKLFYGRGDLHIWGSGFLLPDTECLWPQRLHVHAVRGRASAARIGQPSATLGDPGILADRLIEKRPAKAASVALLPNHAELDWVHTYLQSRLPRGWTVISPIQDVLSVIANICKAEIIAASSLHGLIAADSLGIPCIWVRPHQPFVGGEYKFRDYESVRGTPLGPPISYAVLLERSFVDIEALVSTPGPDFENAKVRLVHSFATI